MMHSPAQLTDAALLAEVKRLAQCERETIATLVAHLVEVEVRDLYRAEGCSSMFTYCTEVLKFSEDAAAVRLQAARAVRAQPRILADLASGALSLSSLRLLTPHLASGNAPKLIEASRHKSKREVEKLVREWFPLPDVPAAVRKLPVRGESTLAPAGLVEAAPRQKPIAPLAAERYKVQFTAGAALHDKLRRAQDLLRHRIPNGDLSQVFDLALTALVEKLERQKLAATDRPRASRGVAVGSRVIPADVKRAVWKRDSGRCAFVAKCGRRCSETGCLEFHHVEAFGWGGAATVENISLRCRSHNQYEARLEFGPIVRESTAAWGREV